MSGTGTDPTRPTSGSPRPTLPVIVVGSGPTGLLLAGDVAAAGVPVTVVEKRPHTISNLSRAFGVHARTLEQLDARGLADRLLATGSTLTELRLFRRLTLDLGTLPSRFPFLLVTPQYEVERILEERARALGVEFLFEHELVGLRQDDGGVDLDLRGPDGTAVTRRAAYAVGADGHRSAVRRAVGLPFPGVSVIKSLFLADVRLAERPGSVLTVDGTGDTFAMIASFGDGWYRVMGWNRRHEVPDDVPLDLDEVREVTRGALGTDYGMHDARWLSRFHSDERQAPAYRAGRVFLAGDAAHVHSPAGGQGMNTGLQDAANLGWKLAAVVEGRLPEGLLDTYQTERHPVGRAVVRSSGGLVRLARARHPALRAVRALVAAFLNASRPARTKALAQISGIGHAYPAPRGAHPLTGTRAPDVALAGGRLHEALRGGRFVLITPEPYDAGGIPGGRLGVERWAAGNRRTTVLVRPDGYVAWAADSAGPAETASALATHVG
ncbi:FAD-dependent monooxygenase [Streptomyces capillispiralis]|uniref:2-polyprenyl-6-methoxyphenol hydroxylase-like FAD-dependent oxidoreductase n=1 Tax=Streptomyces capillispiralis TaxID=68182 RepID=A0A561TJW9_9ACTN|nr:FAD-dependent monooxygenase [Streptomyces capillispiralis]TWF87455.1 2-polyprenyl-6-methoxyphenol hydroxylase-like FAD-dependent oxidoreductase [Streptomyces capillispiralis]GHH92616.1 FAD-dependent oxidoreductase [Streptomyces capillispiralis]